MSETYPLLMAIMDLLPPLAFGLGLILLKRTAYRLGGQKSARLIVLGGGLVFTGGFLKACWKLLLALRVADVRLLSEQQFILLAPGFLLLWWGTLLMMRTPSRGPSLIAIAPWKIPLLALMTLGSLGAHVTLSVVSFKRGARLAGALFIVAVVCMLAMSGMARGEQRIALQLLEQCVNVSGQGAFAIGCVQLERTTR